MKNKILLLFKKTYSFLTKTPLRKIPGAWRFSNFIFRKIRKSGNIIEVQGSKMNIDFNEPNLALRKTFQAYAMNLVHEETTTGLLGKIIKPGETFLDLGANIGYFTLLAARLTGPKGKVFAFEPEPRNFHYLKKNIEINNYSNVSAFQKAASDKNEKIKLFVCGYDSGHHTIKKENGIEAYRQGRKGETREVEVDAVKIDDFLKDEKIDFVKMDVEGAEFLAVSGMEKKIKENNDIKILMEFFPLLIEEMGYSPEELIRKLREFGLKIFIVGHDYAMEKVRKEYIRVSSYREIKEFMKEKHDHFNLYLIRGDEIRV